MNITPAPVPKTSTDSETLELLAQHESSHIRVAVAQNKNTLRSTVDPLAGNTSPHNPFVVFCTKLFTGQLITGTPTAKQPAVTLSDLAAMPKQTQLLLAHVLEQRNPDLMLLDNDTDLCKLLSTGWLLSLPCPTPGFMSFKIKPHFWRQLNSLRTKFLTNHLLFELESYRKRKSALYPWVWWWHSS